jgi:broad specificity phosphatase PhoE
MILAASVLWFLAAASPQTLGPVPAGVVRIYLVRHGQAFSNLEPKPSLPPDQLDRLTDLGHEQARRAGAALRAAGISLIVSSPAGRARETAEEIRAALGAPPVRVDTHIRPIEYGHGPDGKELSWDDRSAEWKAGRDPVPPGGESMEQMGNRVIYLVEAEAREHPGASVVFVCHGEVIGAFVGLVKNLPPAKRYPTAPNGSLTVVEARVGAPPSLLLLDFVPVEAEAPKH